MRRALDALAQQQNMRTGVSPCQTSWRESGTTLLAQDSLGQGGLGHLAWPGTQDGLGQGRLRLKWAKGRFGSKIDEKSASCQNGLAYSGQS